MKLFTKTKRRIELDKEIDECIACLKSMVPESEQYRTAVENIKKLEELKSCSKMEKPSSDMILYTASTLVGILVILNFEKADVITSKAMQYLPKWRV